MFAKAGIAFSTDVEEYITYSECGCICIIPCSKCILQIKTAIKLLLALLHTDIIQTLHEVGLQKKCLNLVLLHVTEAGLPCKVSQQKAVRECLWKNSRV